MKLRTVGSSLAAVVALLAVAVGVVGKVNPHLFMRLPMGFVLWLATGHELPPFFESAPLQKEHFYRYARDGDLVQATMPKAGTVWLQNIFMLLTHKGDDSGNMMKRFGMMEIAKWPGETVEQRLKTETAKRVPGVPLGWFSHQFPKPGLVGLDVKANPKIKYLLAVRNGREVIKSLHPFLNGHTKEWKDLWGGFPPGDLSKEEAMNLMVKDTPMLFGYLKAWWPLRNEPNVHMVHFSNLKADLRGEVTRLADFLGIDASGYMDTVLEKASFAYMKRNWEKYTMKAGPNGDMDVHYPDNHMRSGVSDGGGDFFTAAMNASWDEAFARELGHDPVLQDWFMNGGPLPP